MSSSDEELDRLLKMSTLRPPDSFTSTVMSAVSTEAVLAEAPASAATSTSDSTNLNSSFQPIKIAKWIALGFGGLLGFSHSLYFVLGLWFATSAA